MWILYVCNEANAWDQASSVAVTKININNISIPPVKIAVGLDYPQFPAVDAATGRLFVPLSLHNKVVIIDPRISFGKLKSPGLNISVSIITNGALWEPTVTAFP